MKSIKEKAEEYSFIGQGIGTSGIQYRDFSINKKDGFEAGANYVLDAITDVINQPMNDYLVLGELKKVIEQLKK